MLFKKKSEYDFGHFCMSRDTGNGCSIAIYTSIYNVEGHCMFRKMYFTCVHTHSVLIFI